MITFEELEELMKLESESDKSDQDFASIGWYYKRPTPEKEMEILKKFYIDWIDWYLICSYAGASCRYLNEQLRRQNLKTPSEFALRHKELLTEALRNVKRYNEMLCCRWLKRMPQAGFDYLKSFNGKIIQTPQFLSTSKWKAHGASNYYIFIQTSNKSKGCDIELIVDKPGEKEILFPPDTQFLIEDVAENHLIVRESIDLREPDLILYENYWLNS